MYTCEWCQTPNLGADDFYMRSNGRRMLHCKICQQEVAQRWRDKNRARVRRVAAEYQKTHLVEKPDPTRLVKNQVSRREYYLGRNYRMAHQDYEDMLQRQNGVCLICGRADTQKDPVATVKLLVVDHDHKTGKVRGLLCSKCNLAVGLLDDDVERAQGLVEYLNLCKD
jgi:Recombination endonuclease VII